MSVGQSLIASVYIYSSHNTSNCRLTFTAATGLSVNVVIVYVRNNAGLPI